MAHGAEAFDADAVTSMSGRAGGAAAESGCLSLPADRARQGCVRPASCCPRAPSRARSARPSSVPSAASRGRCCSEPGRGSRAGRGDLGLRCPCSASRSSILPMWPRSTCAAGGAACTQGLDRADRAREPRQPDHGRHDDAAARRGRRPGGRGGAHHCRHGPPGVADPGTPSPDRRWSRRCSSCACPTRCSCTATARSTPTRPPSSWPTSRCRARVGARRSGSSRGSR